VPVHNRMDRLIWFMHLMRPFMVGTEGFKLINFQLEFCVIRVVL